MLCGLASLRLCVGFFVWILAAIERKERRDKNLCCSSLRSMRSFAAITSSVSAGRVCTAICQNLSVPRRSYHGWQDDTDGTNAECRMQDEEFLSVKSVKSVVQFLWLRLAALGISGLLAINQWKFLSMNHLHAKRSVSSQARSRLVKLN